MSSNERKREIIENYINAYNNFDLEGMLRDFDDKVVFRNISNGDVNVTTNGIEEFRRQAEQAKKIFSQREQKITGWDCGENAIEVSIAYSGTLAADLPNGLKQGEKINLNGKSNFRFAGDKIIELEDVS